MFDNKSIKKILKQQFKQFAKQSAFSFYSPTILLREQKEVLNIINFDVISDRVYYSLAVQPLYVPENNIVLSFGSRSELFVGETEEQYAIFFNEVCSAIESKGLTWFSNYGHPEGIIKFIEQSPDISNFRVLGFAHFLRQLYLGFSYLYVGSLDSADGALEKVEVILKDDGRKWAVEVKKLAGSMRILVRTEPSAVKQKLDEFTAQTKQILKL